MNYNSIEEILSSGTTNMTIIRNNSRQDDGTDTITGVDWFTFNGTVVSTIYANGNSWIGFGSSSEHLRVNRRDGAMQSLYREEGTLLNCYKFLKIRWKGYSNWNASTNDYALEYDVILWDTGDISLHMVSIPISYNNGTYNLTADTTYSYTISNDNPNVTFTKTDNSFTVSNNIINLIPPSESRYLIKSSNNILYTILDGVKTILPTTDLTSNTFLTYGTSQLTSEFVTNCSSDESILIWYENIDYGTPTGITVIGTPPLPQIVGVDIGASKTLLKAIAICSDDVLFTVSYDSANKYYYNKDTSKWELSDSDLIGMSPSILEQLTENEWNSIPNSENKTNCIIYASLPTVNSYCRKIYYNAM